MEKEEGLSSLIRDPADGEFYSGLSRVLTLEEYLELVHKAPDIARTAYQRLYDMILSFGKEEYRDLKKSVVRYRFFDDPMEDGKDAIFGLDIPLMKLVDIFKSAAGRYGTERRIILLHGPVGSSKSTIVRLLKKGLEYYSRTEEGALFTLLWKDIEAGNGWVKCPMNEEPLNMLPKGIRKKVEGEINVMNPNYPLVIEGELCPLCRFMYRRWMEESDGDFGRLIGNIRVRRVVFSEKDRQGIGTFQPKDEKNQDSTELTGDLNYRKIAEYGSDSDPRAFNFDGEFNIANRGLIEFIEVYKLDIAFLYDLLTASQEHKIKPKKFPHVDIDEVIIAHTNEPEYRKLQNNEFMEALRDRTLKVDIPYVSRVSEEVKIYRRDFNREKVRHKHIAPHTLEVASMWAVLTRLEEPKKGELTLMQKMKLYDGKLLPGFTEDSVKELRKESKNDGMLGISPRYIQDKLSNAIVRDYDQKCVNPFMVLNELEGGLKHHSLITSEEQRDRYRELLAMIRKEYENIAKNEVQKAICADEEAISRLCANYIDNVKAYTLKEKVKNRFTGKYEEPNERLMRSIEEKIDIPENRKDDFRKEIMNYIGALALEGKHFDYRANERLHRALELKLFEDQKDSIKLSSLVSSVMDRESQEKIEVVRGRLMNNYGYCEVCAGDVLQFVASIYGRGDAKEEG